MIRKKIGVVTYIKSVSHDISEVIVDIDGKSYNAVSYIDLVDEINISDRVLLNTTAIDLNLGTGGFHFVIANLSQPMSDAPIAAGHIMKLRYTPYQTAILSIEEIDHPGRESINNTESLNGLPVICCELHSQIAPAAASIKNIAGYDVRIAYIMTDGAALPLAFSRLIKQLKETKLIDATITCGQAFGGDIESINLYTALIAAKASVCADAVIVSQGPGNAGADTKYGFSGIQQGESLNAVGVLGGKPIMPLRISFADKRDRHYGVSHHSITILDKILSYSTIIGLPILDSMKSGHILNQINSVIDESRHITVYRDGYCGIEELKKKNINVTTMGRHIDEDIEFFLSPAACGAVAIEML